MASPWLLPLLAGALAAPLAVQVEGSRSWREEGALVVRQDQEALLTPAACLSPAGCGAVTRWYVATPIARDYDNARACMPASAGCAGPIGYRIRELAGLRGESVVSLARLQALLGLGTHWLTVGSGDEPLPGETLTSEAPTAFALVIRRDDSYVGYVTELLGLPFVHVPGLTSQGAHLTDRRLGADCAALVIYGQRRLGRRLPYMAPRALRRFTEPVPRDGSGAQPVKRGDVLHFGFQTAVLSEDRGRPGVLDEEDLILHTYHGSAEEVPFGLLPYRQSAGEVRRWPAVDEGAEP